MKSFIFAICILAFSPAFAQEGVIHVHGGQAAREGYAFNYQQVLEVYSQGTATAIDPATGRPLMYPGNPKSNPQPETMIFQCMRYFTDGQIWKFDFDMKLEFRPLRQEIIQTNIGTSYPQNVYRYTSDPTQVQSPHFATLIASRTFSVLQTGNFTSPGGSSASTGSERVLIQAIGVVDQFNRPSLESLIMCKQKSAILQL